MRWSDERRSDNVEDERGTSFGRPLALGGGAAATIIGLIIYLLTGQGINTDSNDRRVVSSSERQLTQKAANPRQDRMKDFVSAVLASTEDTWPPILGRRGVKYQDPKLVLFSNAVESACGFEQSAVGPFYCPEDSRVYLDLNFFRALQRLGAPGEFAQAYVIAHEVGHHVQNLLGISDQVRSLRRRMGTTNANALSILTELQADCFAGVWAHHANDTHTLIEPGETDQGLAAAAAVGDDRLQQRALGHVAPESFTHGTSKQRTEWFRRGLERGSVQACDTFGQAGVHLNSR